MRRIAMAVAAAALLAGASGCGLLGQSKASCGWGAWVGCPATVNTEMPVLVNQGAPYQSAQPVGAVSGPVIGGQWTHGAGQVAPLAQQACAPLTQQPAPRLSCEEWCELQRRAGLAPQGPAPLPPPLELQQRRMPKGHPEADKDKEE